MKIDIKKAVFSLASVAAALVLGMLSGGDMKDTYLSLKRPWYAPPPAVFPIVWSILYLLMGESLYKGLKGKSAGFFSQKGMEITFLCGLLLSALWPMAFFRFQLFHLAFYLIVAMLVLGAFTEIDFYRVSRRAALCYLPYLLWLIFALFLNHAVARLNG